MKTIGLLGGMSWEEREEGLTSSRRSLIGFRTADLR